MLTIFVHGGVEAIDTEADTITIWLNGFTGYHVTPVTADMPPWMLRRGAAFFAEIPEDNWRRRKLDGVVWLNVIPNPYGHMDEDEILKELCEIFAHLDPFTERKE